MKRRKWFYKRYRTNSYQNLLKAGNHWSQTSLETVITSLKVLFSLQSAQSNVEFAHLEIDFSSLPAPPPGEEVCAPASAMILSCIRRQLTLVIYKIH
jgi:hypothetical protein